MSEIPKLRDLVCREAPQDALDAFNTSRDDWSSYRDHEKREMAYAAGWRSAMLAVTKAMMAEGLDK